jgi:hypothetical protein
VDALVLLVMLTASMALAVMGARGLLVAVLHVMAHPPAPARIRWGRVVFGVAIFWFLYMAPAIAARVPAGLVKSVLP